MNQRPVIIAFYDGDPEVQCLSNFAKTPFVLDGIEYNSVEAFWQSLKTEIPALREQIRLLDGINAKKAGKLVQGSSNLFTYQGKIFKVGSKEHHTLLERAIRAKVAQNESVKRALLNTRNAPLKHMLKNRFGQLRVGDSPALPAVVFENILMNIRQELQNNTFTDNINIPAGLNDF